MPRCQTRESELLRHRAVAPRMTAKWQIRVQNLPASVPPRRARSDGMAFGEAPSVLESRNDCLELLRCPRTGLPLRQADASTLVTATADAGSAASLRDCERPSGPDRLRALGDRRVGHPGAGGGEPGPPRRQSRSRRRSPSGSSRRPILGRYATWPDFVALLKASTPRPMVLGDRRRAPSGKAWRRSTRIPASA